MNRLRSFAVKYFALLLCLVALAVPPSGSEALASTDMVVVSVDEPLIGVLQAQGASIIRQLNLALVPGDVASSRAGLTLIGAPSEVRPAEVGVDPLRSEQYALELANVSPAWEYLGRRSVVVALLDSGVDFSHPDLAALPLANSPHAAATALLGDTCGHGTRVAGLLAATVGNDIGMSGVSRTITLLPMNVLPLPQCRGNTFLLALGIVNAVDEGASVIIMSLSAGSAGAASPPELLRALAYAEAHDVAVVVAAGNTNGGLVTPPADAPTVIAVGCVTARAEVCTYSAIDDRIDLWAPGDRVLTTVPGGLYLPASGTSFSAPHVAGAAANARSLAVLSVSELRELLRSEAQPILPGRLVDVGATSHAAAEWS